MVTANPGLPGEYGLFGVLFVLGFIATIVSVLVYGAIKLSLKNPEDIP